MKIDNEKEGTDPNVRTAGKKAVSSLEEFERGSHESLGLAGRISDRALADAREWAMLTPNRMEIRHCIVEPLWSQVSHGGH